MIDSTQVNSDANNSGVSRRSVLKAAAWSVPAIAVASAVPALAASLEVAGCVVEPGVWSAPAEGALHHDGQKGYVAGTTLSGGEVTDPYAPFYSDGPVRTTGWTPVVPSGENALEGEWAENVTTDWGAMNSVTNGVGFLSMDDRNNTSTNERTGPVSFTVTFKLGVQSGKVYSLNLPYYAASTQHAYQYLSISAYVPDVGVQGILAGYVGNSEHSIPLSDHTSYQAFETGGLKLAPVSFSPESDGNVVISYTFTLAESTGGTRQNADIWIGQPVLTSCA